MLTMLWRTTTLYIAVIIALRFMGKRQIGELQPSELVTTIMISNIASIPIENTDRALIGGLIPIITLCCFEVLMSIVVLKSRRARGFIVGHPRALIHDGAVDEREMRNLRWSNDDLMEQLRGNGVFDPRQVDFAIVETNGKLSVYQKFESRPVERRDLGIPKPGCDCPPALVINDGAVIEEALDYCNLTRAWLDGVLEREGLKPGDVFMMSCDRAADFHIVKREAAK